MNAGRERRQHVRVRPTLDLPAEVSRVPADGSSWMLVDISLGGVGIWVRRGSGCDTGEEVRVRLQLGAETVEVNVLVRHRSADGSLQGMAFVEPDERARQVINDYVSELAERGGMA